MKYSSLAVLLFLLALTGCFIAEEINKTMRSWEQAYVSDLIRSWGPPQEVYADGNGGQVFVYTSTTRVRQSEAYFSLIKIRNSFFCCSVEMSIHAPTLPHPIVGNDKSARHRMSN